MLEGVTFELGREMHTFTAIGRCPRTGRLGIAVTTSEMSVGSRAPYVRANVGAVAPQASTAPRLGPLAIELLALGYSATKVMAEIAASDPYVEYRQLGIVDRWGHVAVRTGANNSDWAGHFIGDGWLVMGNYLVGEGVAQAMASAMRETENEELEVRLIRAIDAGTNAGGQPNGQRSACLLVHENAGFSIFNLRVEDVPGPMPELWRLFNKMQPLAPYYRQ